MQPLVRLLVVRRVAEHDLAVAVERDAVVRVGQVLGRQPEVERVLGHQVERQARGRSRRARPRARLASSLPTNEMWPIGYSHSLRAEVEVVQRRASSGRPSGSGTCEIASSTELTWPM